MLELIRSKENSTLVKRVCCFFDLEIEEYVEIAQKIYIFGMLCAIVERISLRLLTGIRVENK